MLNKLFRLASFQLPYGRSKSSKFYRSFLSSLHRQNQCAPQIPPEKHYICGIKNLFTLPFIVLLHRWYIETEGSLFSRSLGLPLNFPKKLSFRLHPSLRKKCPYSKLFWSIFSRIWTKCLSYLVRMRENTEQNYSEYGHFSRIPVMLIWFITNCH